MIKVLPILLAVLTGFVMYMASTFRLKRQLDRQSTELADPRLAALTNRLAQALDLPRIKVHIFEIAPINGLAAPDGRIFITRGFYDKYRLGEVTAEELVSVIAHELGHVALGHSKRRMVDFSGQNAVRVVLTMVLGRFVPFVGPYIANALITLLAASLSRKDEFEADAYAAALLTKAGIGTAPQISLFEKLDKMTGAGGAGPLAWMLSHPKTDKRIAAIQALSRDWVPIAD